MKDYSVIRNEEKIKDFIKVHSGEEPDYDNTVDMPVIGKRFGKYSYEGIDEEVNRLEKYEEYKEYYNKIYEILNTCFKKNLHGIFQNAVNSLIFYIESDEKPYLDETMFEINESISAADTLKKKIDNSPSDDGLRVFKAESNIKQILNMIDVANGSRKRYSPYAISSLINQDKEKSKTKEEVKNEEYILFPKFTERGMVTQVEDGNLELMFDLITKDEAEKIKKYMLSETEDKLTEDFIECTFKEYESYAQNFNSVSDTERFVDTLKMVVGRSISLFDIDITNFKKGAVHVHVMTPKDQFTPIDIIYEDDEDDLDKDKGDHEISDDDDGFDNGFGM